MGLWKVEAEILRTSVVLRKSSEESPGRAGNFCSHMELKHFTEHEHTEVLGIQQACSSCARPQSGAFVEVRNTM